jgi:hypothetical protein
VVVGFLAALRPGIGSAELFASAASPVVGPSPLGLVSPWAPPHHLASVVWSDLFGKGAVAPLTRAEAMRVPAVARSRHIICSTIARDPIRHYRSDGTPLPASWLTTTSGRMSPFHRDTYTADDLLFYGWSLWRRVRNTAPDAAGRTWPLEVARVAMGEWSLEPDTGRVLLNKPDGAGGWTLSPARDDEVILIPGPHEGLLVDAAESIRHAADLHNAAAKAARHPSAYIGLKLQPGAIPLKQSSEDPTELTAPMLVQSWVSARNGDNGGVAYLGQLDAVELGTFSEHLVIDGRNAAAVDIARHASIPADLIDASVPESSLQYTTSQDNDRRALDYGVGFYMGAISARLSQDDVSPHGQRVAFDLEEWLSTTATRPGETAPPSTPAVTPEVPVV